MARVNDNAACTLYLAERRVSLQSVPSAPSSGRDNASCFSEDRRIGGSEDQGTPRVPSLFRKCPISIGNGIGFGIGLGHDLQRTPVQCKTHTKPSPRYTTTSNKMGHVKTGSRNTVGRFSKTRYYENYGDGARATATREAYHALRSFYSSAITLLEAAV